MQTPALAQRGRAAIAFHLNARVAVAALQREMEVELATAGVTAETMPDEIDDRHALVDATLAGSKTHRARAILGEFTARDHGPICEAAFEEIRHTVEPQLKALQNGPTSLELDPYLQLPAYFERVWFHRTSGGWDASEYNGYVHGELIHKLILTKVFGGDIFVQRRNAASKAPRRDYRRVLDMGASSGHNTVALSELFPEAKISGVDFSARMLEQAQRTGNELGQAWKLYQRPCERTGFADGSFDLVSSYNLIHEIPRKTIAEVFQEVFRLLEPGGCMVMADVPRYFELDKLAAWRFDYMARYGGEPYWRAASTLDLVALATQIGFVNVSGGTEARGPYVITAIKPEI